MLRDHHPREHACFLSALISPHVVPQTAPSWVDTQKARLNEFPQQINPCI